MCASSLVAARLLLDLEVHGSNPPPLSCTLMTKVKQSRRIVLVQCMVVLQYTQPSFLLLRLLPFCHFFVQGTYDARLDFQKLWVVVPKASFASLIATPQKILTAAMSCPASTFFGPSIRAFGYLGFSRSICVRFRRTND